MRLHRRKEAGVVVDFSEATAPHSDRTVTVHSLLGVDTYHPGALVTPRSPRRRQRWRRLAKPLVREAGWLVPVTADPLKRREIILRDWKQIAIDRLPVDEQGMWAENAGRRVGRKRPAEAREGADVGLRRDADAVLRHLRGREQAPPAAPDRARRPGAEPAHRKRVRARRAAGRGGADLAPRSRPGLADAAARARRSPRRGLRPPDGGVGLATGTRLARRAVPPPHLGARERPRYRPRPGRQERRRRRSRCQGHRRDGAGLAPRSRRRAARGRADHRSRCQPYPGGRPRPPVGRRGHARRRARRQHPAAARSPAAAAARQAPGPATPGARGCRGRDRDRRDRRHAGRHRRQPGRG